MQTLRYCLWLCATTMVVFCTPSSRVSTRYHLDSFGSVDYNKYGIAFIITQQGWAAIDQEQNIVYTPFNFDNGPDEPKEGLIRFVENGKMGFVDETGQKQIDAQFTFAWPFENGRARACIECKKVYHGEHYRYDAEEWFFINKSGSRIPE